MGNPFKCCIGSKNATDGSSLADFITLLLADVDPIQQIHPLIDFIKTQHRRIKFPTEASTSSSGGLEVESVAYSTGLAAQIMDKISTEAQTSEITEAIVSTALSAIGETHWIFLGLSMTAYALERCGTTEECRELLLTIAEAAKDLKKLREAMPGETEKLLKAVTLLAFGAFMCCQYIAKGKASRYWSATTMEIQLHKTHERIREMWYPTIFARQSQPFQPVGIENKILDVKKLLDMEGSDPAVAVILSGFGGVGKTTLAASVIQNLDLGSTNFKFCRVVIDEKAVDTASHIVKLQKDIIFDFGGGELDLRDPYDGQQQIQRVMESTCCLLFIDNVVDNDYIKQLLPEHLFPATENSKIRILITSRSSDLRPVLGMQIVYKQYYVNNMSSQVSKTLLRNIILEDGSEAHGHFNEDSLIDEMAEACRGVPLLLSVLGNQLKLEREERNYNAALESLKMGDGNLEEKLLSVYRKMDEEYQETFLDICVYFHGIKWDLAGWIVGSRNLETLHRRMLISRSDPGDQVIVHDILRLLGRKEAANTRLLNFEEFEEVLSDESKLRNVKGLALCRDTTSLITLQSIHLDAMQNCLRVLFLGPGVRLDGQVCQGAFKNLRFLFVDDVPVFPFKDVSSMKKLRVFSNKSMPGNKLPRLSLLLQNLRSFEAFSIEAPKPVKSQQGIMLPASLEDFRLKDCKQIPKTIGQLTALESIFVDKCDNEVLPQGFEKLKRLSFLSLQYCRNLTSLPEDFGLLSSLLHLNLNGCALLKALPVSFGLLVALQNLSLQGCENLRSLPEQFGGLASLQELNLTGCIKLERLPESFGMLCLKDLHLKSLHSLKELPQSIGDLASLTSLTVISCDSLIVFPDSFVQLAKLKILVIKSCNKLEDLPKEFGRLLSLNKMIVEDCPSLQELPSGFGELASLEDLKLKNLMLSSLPHGFGKLKRLKVLLIQFCPKLEALVDDFENLGSLGELWIGSCHELEGSAMDRIVNLRYCSLVCIQNSEKLASRWKEIQQQKADYPMEVYTWSSLYDEDWQRGAKIGVLDGHCIELNSTRDALTEHPSMLVEEDSTVAVIILPRLLQHHHEHLVHRVVEMAMERALKASSMQTRVVCVRKVALDGETPHVENKSLTQILKWLPKGSLAIPSTDNRRLSLIKHLFFPCSAADEEVICFMAEIMVDDKAYQTFVNGEITGEDEISGTIVNRKLNSIEEEERAHIPSAEEISLYSNEHEEVSMWTWFSQALKTANIDHFTLSSSSSSSSQVMLDQLSRKTIWVIICDLKSIECIKLQQIYKHFQQMEGDSCQGIWIPLSCNEDDGFAAYRRAVQSMPWASLLHPKLIRENCPRFIVFDKWFGTILNQNAFPTIMSWGIQAYPFTKSKIDFIVSGMHTKSSLEFLFDAMEFLGPEGIKVKRESINGKLIFLYSEPASKNLKMKSRLQQLLQAHEDFKILYVGYFSSEEQQDVEAFEKLYEDTTQTMQWLKLSFSDMIMFWYRCKYMLNEMGEQLNMCLPLQQILEHLYIEKKWLLLLDSNGMVTSSGQEVMDIMCKENTEDTYEKDTIRNELIDSLKRGKCNQKVKLFFGDELSNFPNHRQHCLMLMHKGSVYCNVCSWLKVASSDQKRIYHCKDCDWSLCKDCWEKHSIEEIST